MALTQWACEAAAASLAGCAGMICNLAVKEWDLEGIPDSRAELLFLTSTVCESFGEVKDDGGCEVQRESFESAPTWFLLAPGNHQTKGSV